MYLLKNIQFFYNNSSNLDTGVEGLALLNNDFFYAFTLYEKFAAWKEIDELEDQYSTEQIEAVEEELLNIYGKARNPVVEVHGSS